MLAEKPHKRACERLAESFPDCCCEKETVCPDLSPGTVQDHEILARLVPEKDFDTVTKTIKPTLFEKAAQNGMSVTRLGSAIGSVSEERAPGAFVGFVTALCGNIREALHEGRRAFAVYDTAIPSNIRHADVCQTTCYPGSLAIKIRRQLQEAFSSDLHYFDDSAAEPAANSLPPAD